MEDTQSAFRKHLIRAFKYIFPFDRRKTINNNSNSYSDSYFFLDFRLPLPFIGAVAAMIMLLYQV